MCLKKVEVHLHVFPCLGEGLASFLKDSSFPSKKNKIQKGHKLLVSWNMVSVSLTQESAYREPQTGESAGINWDLVGLGAT